MVKTRAKKSESNGIAEQFSHGFSLTETVSLGKFIHGLVGDQFNQICRLESDVIRDDGSAAAKQFHLAIQQLQTVLETYGNAIMLPKQGGKRWQNLGGFAVELYSLDHQIDQLKQNYRALLLEAEQKKLTKVLKNLSSSRSCSFLEFQEAIAQPRYIQLKEGYQAWLTQPQYAPLGRLPLIALLPSLVSSQLSQFLLHPGWFQEVQTLSDMDHPVFQELREAVVQFRHQLDLLSPLYGSEFQVWRLEIDKLQQVLVQLQENRQFHQNLMKHLDRPKSLLQFDEQAQQQYMLALSEWEDLRSTYLSKEKRDRLHHLVLEPCVQST
jgi:CHAD domain-containing protein